MSNSVINALRVEYNRGRKTYDVELIKGIDGNIGAWAQTCLVYTDGMESRVLEQIEAGSLLSHWKPAKRETAVKFLQSICN
jgi:hypothetical protein